jgi:uncharacterized membrane protein YozB (DUF420 family)
VTIHDLPAVNATLNATAALLLSAGWALIRRRRVAAHRACMIAAFACSALFFLSYVTYHAHVGSVRFPLGGLLRGIYLSILATHVVLAAAVLPLALATLLRAARGDFARHRKIARLTLPVWLYVSATGVIVYALLYEIAPRLRG